jgi:hypothetical protein
LKAVAAAFAFSSDSNTIPATPKTGASAGNGDEAWCFKDGLFSIEWRFSPSTKDVGICFSSLTGVAGTDSAVVLGATGGSVGVADGSEGDECDAMIGVAC